MDRPAYAETAPNTFHPLLNSRLRRRECIELGYTEEKGKVINMLISKKDRRWNV